MAFSTSYTFGFSAVICVTCSLAVSFAAASLKDIQDVNKARDRRGSILTAFDITGLSGEAIDAAYAEQIRVVIIDGNGTSVPTDGFDDGEWADMMDRVEAFRLKDNLSRLLGKSGELSEEQWAEYREDAILAVYQQVDSNQDVVAYAVPVHGVGLWGPIYGYLALQPDLNTVVGATFSAPAETPGLGFEIVNTGFTGQFPGKEIYRDNGDLASISVVKGGVDLACSGATEYCVQGVSGATITSNGVDYMFEGLLTAYKPYLDQIRAGGGS
ncbi:MAG: Na+-transporting NADH:ubiquinone oxidoreductase subunit C [Myxococcota bacterium]|jgi:Na+-transporting NADH:ubiquinone oxidoreductase subunit C